MKKTILVSIASLSIGLFSCQKQEKAAEKIIPVEKDGKYSFNFEGIYFEVDPNMGGRISSFKLEGKEVLYTDKSNGNNWGSTFWPAPQSVWGWPPSDTLDSKPYTTKIEGNKLIMNSLPTKGKTNCAFEKIFEVDEKDKSVSVTYKIHNTSKDTIAFGSWQIARVPSGGLVYFPTGTTTPTGDLVPLLSNSNGVSWFDYDSAFIAKDPEAIPKLFSDGADGWMAFINNDGNALLFKFTDTPASMKAPGEEEIELYTHHENIYTELEPFGPFNKIAPNSASTWTVKWYLRKLPTNIEVKVGSQSLIDFAKEIVK